MCISPEPRIRLSTTAQALKCTQSSISHPPSSHETLVQRWVNVDISDGGLALTQHWVNVSCALGIYYWKVSFNLNLLYRVHTPGGTTHSVRNLVRIQDMNSMALDRLGLVSQRKSYRNFDLF